MDGRPGPVTRRVTAIDKYNKFISYPPRNPFESWTVIVYKDFYLFRNF
jgi:hypothetical protein